MAANPSQVVTLWGKEMKSDTPGAIVFDIEPAMGDAPRYKLAGQITFLKRQVLERYRSNVAGGWDFVRLPEHIAELYRNRVGNVRRRRRR